MATATVARPANALRHRRDVPRPTLAKRQTNVDGVMEPAGKKRKLDEPFVRTQAYILRKHKGKPPSLVVHLHPTHFRFDGQDGSFAYDSPMSFVIKHLRRQTVPHEMIEQLLEQNVPFYDGCLIVEVHNHRTAEGKDKSRSDSANEDAVKFSMHNYNAHITPSPMAPYPSKAARRADDTPEKNEGGSGDMAAPERPKEKDGPRITTIVLQPTALSNHNEMSILMNTPASDVRSKKKASDVATPSSAHPSTPQLSVPPTPISQTARGSSSQPQKMCLEESDFYTFQAEMLLATEPPLYLEPVDNPQDAQKVLDMLQDPLHQDKPPSPKTRKRTTAEVAADDAQAAETERRMLIMDERIKPSGPGAAANENQGAAASLGFSRFKTIEMVKQKLEETDRQKKEDELRASMESEQQRQAVAQQQLQNQQAMMAQRSRDVAAARHRQQQQQMQVPQANPQQELMMQQRQAAMRQQALTAAQANQAQMASQGHGHPSQNAMMQAHQQQQMNQTSMAQSSPIVRQQTPMMNSSPMMPQNGFPMTQTSSQGAGSPPRPTSAINPMARQVSQQQHGSRNNTPQIPQGTPSMASAIPNRQMTQTPRMQPGSPVLNMQQGTPTSATMQSQTPHMNAPGLTPEQMAMIQQQRAIQISQGQQSNSMQAGSPPQSMMTPEQISNIQHMQRQQAQNMMQRNAVMQATQAKFQQAQAQGNTAAAAQYQQQLQHLQQQSAALKQRHQQMMLQQQQANAQMHGTPGPAGSPAGMPHQTPQMNHAHPTPNMQDPNQMTQQQQQQALAQAQAKAAQLAHVRQQQQVMQQQMRQQLQSLQQQYGQIQAIPAQVLQTLPPQVQNYIRNQIAMQQRQQANMRAQQMGSQNQGQGMGGGSEQVPGGQPNPGYMQQLRNNQAMLAQAHQQQQMTQNQNQQGGMNNLAGMSFHMNGMGQNFGNQQGGADLGPQFAAMAHALNRGQQQNGGGQGGMQ